MDWAYSTYSIVVMAVYAIAVCVTLKRGWRPGAIAAGCIVAAVVSAVMGDKVMVVIWAVLSMASATWVYAVSATRYQKKL